MGKLFVAMCLLFCAIGIASWYWSSGLEFRSFVLAKLSKIILPEIRPQNTTKALEISRRTMDLIAAIQPGAVNSKFINLGGGVAVHVFTTMNETSSVDPLGPQVPVLLWFHGGGFVEGSVVADSKNCQKIANITGFVVVSVEYRLAPEHIFPAAVNDGMKALTWTFENIRFYGGNKEKLIIGGESAGGNLAASTIIGYLTEERRWDGQVIGYLGVYPCLDHGSYTESHYKFRHTSGFLPLVQMQWYYSLYLGQDQSIKAEDVRACPGRVPDELLKRFPQTFMIMAEQDVVFDEGVNFVRRLKVNNVIADYYTFRGTIHGFFGRPSFGASGTNSLLMACEEIKKISYYSKVPMIDAPDSIFSRNRKALHDSL